MNHQPVFRCIRLAAIPVLALWTVLGAVQAQAQPIAVGQVGPFTGLPSPDAHEVNAGAQAYFDSVNKSGGVSGRKIEFFKIDDEFKGDVFLKKLEESAVKKPIALITPIGSAALQNAIKEDVFSKYDFLVINAIPGADAFRTPGHPRLFHIRASDGQQIAKITGHANAIGVKSMLVFHQDLPIGTSGLAKAKESGAQQKITVTSVQSKHEPAALKAAAEQASRAAPPSVLVIGTPRFMADAVAALRTQGVGGQLFALSYLSAGLASKTAGNAGARGLGIAQTYPNPNSPNLPVMREFQETMKEHAPKVTALTAFHFEGYISARVLVDGLRRTGANLTTERLAAALRSAGLQNYGGFSVDFSKGNSGSGFVDIAVVDSGGKLRY